MPCDILYVDTAPLIVKVSSMCLLKFVIPPSVEYTPLEITLIVLTWPCVPAAKLAFAIPADGLM